MRRLLGTIFSVVFTQFAMAQTNTFPGSGSVGIGTTAPASKLHVVDGNGGEQIKLTRGTGSVRFVQSGNIDDLYLLNGVGSKTFMYWAHSGNVGIGNFSPQANLHIGKPEASAGSTGEIIRLSLQPYGHNGGRWDFKSRDNPTMAFLDINYGSTQGITINSSGNVGIGNYNPQANLHIGKPEASPGSTGEMIRLSLQPYGHNGGRWDFKSRDNAQLAFLDIQYGTTQAITINSSGKVGIGTNDPDAPLTVKGVIHTNEVRVDLLAPIVPDYVFEKDYDLLSLSELETYITQNKHLPEVPSAKEMEANGLNLKEMNLLLLKKVEELTLHLIEQSKKIESQDNEIGSQRTLLQDLLLKVKKYEK